MKVPGGANFGAFDAHLVVYCAKVVHSIPSFLTAEVGPWRLLSYRTGLPTLAPPRIGNFWGRIFFCHFRHFFSNSQND